MNILKKLFGSKSAKTYSSDNHSEIVSESIQNYSQGTESRIPAVKQYFKTGLFNKFISILVTACFIISIVNLLAFANIEAPIDDTQKPQSYPNFNMPQAYIEAAVDAGFDVFSLCNNHTNDQGRSGIKETVKSAERLVKRSKERGEDIYFSGLKDGKDAQFSYNVIEKNGWRILFLPMTEILNRPQNSEYINYIDNSEKSRKDFIKYVKQLRESNPCDLMVLSIHAYEVEYTRKVTESQNKYYMDLLDAGVDVLWANHAHIIKDRKYIYYSETQSHKVIMYANGNTISGQRTKP